MTLGMVCALAALGASCNDKQPPLEAESIAPLAGSDEDAATTIPEDDAGQAEPVDAGTVDAGNDDAAVPACDKTKPFGAPTRIPGTDGTVLQATPRLSADELTVYFTTRVDGAAYETAKISRLTRTSTFGPMILLSAINSADNDNDPAPSADHLSLWFHSSRTGGGDIYKTARTSQAVDFGAAVAVSGINTPSVEAHAYYRQAGGELWFMSDRGGNADIYMAKAQGGGFAAPTAVAELNSADVDQQPQISEDGLTILFASTRAGGAGGTDLWLARRPTTGVAFGPPEVITEVNSAANDQAGWLSADGCRLYFSSTRDNATGDQLFFAERPK